MTLPAPTGPAHPDPLLSHLTARQAVEAAAREHLRSMRCQIWGGPGMLTSEDGLEKAVQFTADLFLDVAATVTLTGTPLPQIMEAFLEGRLAALQADLSTIKPPVIP